MENKFTEEEILEIAAQLRKPDGEFGIDVAKRMEEGNIGMTRKTITALQLQNGDKILEIGHGNASHLGEILASAEKLAYSGLDISNLMHKEAQRINAAFVDSGKASFHLYDGENIAFGENSFDKIMTVNTIYFWDDPTKFLQGIYRVLRPNGLFSICFGQRNSMENLPFTKHGFELYDTPKLKSLVASTKFKIKETQDHRDSVISKTGEPVERGFSVFVLEI